MQCLAACSHLLPRRMASPACLDFKGSEQAGDIAQVRSPLILERGEGEPWGIFRSNEGNWARLGTRHRSSCCSFGSEAGGCPPFLFARGGLCIWYIMSLTNGPLHHARPGVFLFV